MKKGERGERPYFPGGHKHISALFSSPCTRFKKGKACSRHFLTTCFQRCLAQWAQYCSQIPQGQNKVAMRRQQILCPVLRLYRSSSFFQVDIGDATGGGGWWKTIYLADRKSHCHRDQSLQGAQNEPTFRESQQDENEFIYFCNDGEALL